MKVALYARYSSDNQRDASIHDQFQVCRAFAEKQGWQVVEEYSDHAVSGASLLRPGIQALITDATRGRFQCVLAEAMDRLSRDQEDIAGLFKRMVYGNVKIVTLAEGEVSHLHIGLKGTMNALFVKDLADKTHRGLRGRVEQGKSGGGNAYGYAVVRSVDSEGDVGRGDRKIKPDESAVVQRIFREFAGGKSAKKIAGDLNRDGIPGPSGGAWGFSTILGNSKRGTGILNNELYTGRLVWNRQRYIKDPETGRRQARPNPPEEWITHNVPALRIVEAALWDAAKGRQAQTQLSASPGSAMATFRDRARARYLLSGLTKCGVCGGGYSQISSTSVGCSTARNKGTCNNRVNIRRDVLETRVLSALRDRLMEPALFKRFCDEFTRETNRLRMEGRAKIDAMNAEISRINKDLDMLVELILRGGNGETLSAKMLKLEERRRFLNQELAIAVEPPPLLHPEMAAHYRQELDKLYEALEQSDDIVRLRASEVLRSLMESVILTPDDGELTIDLKGDLASILHIAVNAKKPAVYTAGDSQFELVAGTGFEPVTFRL